MAKIIKGSMRYPAEFLKGLDHVLKTDPSLESFAASSEFDSFEIDSTGEYRNNQSAFEYLTRSVIGQQVSGAAAASILRKFKLMYNKAEDDVFPLPEEVLKSTPDELRSAGLSFRKAEYVQGLASAFHTGTLDDQTLRNSSDDEVVDALVALKGIGPWTADMFLIFCIRHLDVLSVGDLGVQKGFARYLQDRPELAAELKQVDWSVPLEGTHSPGKSSKAQNRKVAMSPKKRGPGPRLPTSQEMEWVAARFRPYRTVFQLIMWRYADTNTEVFSKLTKEPEKVEEIKEELKEELPQPPLDAPELGPVDHLPSEPASPTPKRRRTRSQAAAA